MLTDLEIFKSLNYCLGAEGELGEPSGTAGYGSPCHGDRT